MFHFGPPQPPSQATINNNPVEQDIARKVDFITRRVKKPKPYGIYTYTTFRRKALREREIEGHMSHLMKYLAIHDPELLRRAEQVRKKYSFGTITMRNDIRKTIGKTHWRRFLDFYHHHSETGESIAVAPEEWHTATPPPFPTLSTVLNNDVTSKIFDFLDGETMYEASKVSRAFRDSLVPRQKNVTIEGFKSIESFRQMNFMGMVFFSAEERTDLVTESFLEETLSCRRSYPNLERVELLGCFNPDPAKYVQNMGPRYETGFDRVKAFGEPTGLKK